MSPVRDCYNAFSLKRSAHDLFPPRRGKLFSAEKSLSLCEGKASSPRWEEIIRSVNLKDDTYGRIALFESPPRGKHKRGTYLFNLFNLLTRVNSLQGIEANSRKFVAKEKYANDVFL